MQKVTRPGELVALDVVLAAALTLALQVEIWAPEYLAGSTEAGNRLLLTVTSLVTSVSLVWRRRFPWAVAIAAFTAEVLASRLTTPPDGLANLVTMLVVAYSLGRYTRPPRAYAGAVLILAVAVLVGEDGADATFVTLVLGAAWAAGLLVARRTDDLDVLELKRLEATRAGAEEERLRIARELHDVVAHRVSLIVVQSQLADSLVDRDPAAARTAIQTIERAGRAALDELRSVLGLLHSEGDETARRTPEDTDLTRLQALVEDARAGGLPATLVVEGDARPVPPMVALATLRIVQESLTNVVKHAGSAPTRVCLTYRSGDLDLVVDNDGYAAAADPVTPGGHGLAGMAERAAFVGGTLVAGPRGSGGFRVHAVLPLPVTASTQSVTSR